MKMSRRVLLKVLAALPAGAVLAQAEPGRASRSVSTGFEKEEWEFHPYLGPELIGWKGYWYRRRDSGVEEIMAFEALDGTKVASPWVLQIPRRPGRSKG